MSSTVPSYWKKTECNATTVALKIENWDTFGGLEFFLFAGAPPHAANAQCIAPAKTLVDNEACVHWPIKKRSHVTCITHVTSEETWFSAVSSATRMDLWIHSSFQVSPSELWRCLSRTLTLLSSGHSPAHCFFFSWKTKLRLQQGFNVPFCLHKPSSALTQRSIPVTQRCQKKHLVWGSTKGILSTASIRYVVFVVFSICL